MNVDGIPCATVARLPRRRVGGHDARRPPLLPGGAPLPRHRTRGNAPPLLGLRHDRRARSTSRSRRCAPSPTGRRSAEPPGAWLEVGRGRLLLRLGARHAGRAGARAGRAAGAARARGRARSARTAASPSRSSGRTSRRSSRRCENQKIRFEAIHRYELDDDGRHRLGPRADGGDGMKITRQPRRRSRALAALFLAAFAAIGAVSRSTPASPQRRRSDGHGRRAVPSSPWYWTMAVAPSDPNVLVVGYERAGSSAPSDGGKTLAARRARRPSTRRASSSRATRSSRAAALGPTTRLRSRGPGRRAPRRSARASSPRAPTAARRGHVVHPAGLPNALGPGARRRPGLERLDDLCGAHEREALPLHRRREVVQARLGEARDPALGDRGHRHRRLRRRRHGHGAPTRARTATKWTRTKYTDSKGGRW